MLRKSVLAIIYCFVYLLADINIILQIMFLVTFIFKVLIITVILGWIILAIQAPISFTVSSMVYVIPHIKKAINATKEHDICFQYVKLTVPEAFTCMLKKAIEEGYKKYRDPVGQRPRDEYEYLIAACFKEDFETS